MSNILDRLRRRLLDVGPRRWAAIVEAINTGCGEADRISYHTLRKIAYRDAQNPGIKTVQLLLDYFAQIDAGTLTLPEPETQEAA
jgi:hypothetical protein